MAIGKVDWMNWHEVPLIGAQTSLVNQQMRDGRLITLDETGYEALLSWCAGSSLVVRVLASGPLQGHARLVRIDQDGTEHRSQRQFTAADQTDVDDAIDEYLADAQVLPGRVDTPGTSRFQFVIPAARLSGRT